MDKERLMQFLSDAIDMGFEIEVRNCNANINRDQAKVLAERFSGIVEGKIEEVDGKYSDWLRVRSKGDLYCGSFFDMESRKAKL